MSDFFKVDRFVDDLLKEKKPTKTFNRSDVQGVSDFIDDIVSQDKIKNYLRDEKKSKVSAFIYQLLKEKIDKENQVKAKQFLKQLKKE
jgi:hypothetical protein